MSLHNIDKRIVIGPWANTRELAKRLGCLDFFTGIACINGHITIRRASNGKCYECERATWERVRRRKGKKPFAPNEQRQAAETLGEKFFVGAPCPHGHDGKRWTHNGACVECTMKAARDYHKTPEGQAYTKAWRIENIDTVREYGRHQKAKRKGAEGRHTAQDVRDILKRQKFKCAECGTSVRKQSNRHVDHIMPLKLGGTNWPSNIQVLCPACNLSKNARHPFEWARIRGRLL